MSIEPVGTIISSLKDGVDLWVGGKVREEELRQRKRNAINAVLRAVRETRAYLYDKEVLEISDRADERNLFKVWQDAAEAIEMYDKHLYDSSNVKSLCYGDPRKWAEWKQHAATVDLDLIEKQCEWLKSNET